MLFRSLVTLVASIGLVSAQRSTTAQGQAGLGVNQGLLTANVAVTGCTTVQLGAYEQIANLPLLGNPFVAIGASTCVCLEVDVDANGQITGTRLTDATLSALNTLLGTPIPGITAQLAGGIGVPTVVLYTTAQLLTILENEAIVTLDNGRQSSCAAGTFPTGSIPACDCSFTCQSGRVKCGNSCQVGTVCPTGMRRREFGGDLATLDLHCPARHTACAVPGSTQFFGDNFECVNTAADLESCGGCIHPLPGKTNYGQDCTAIRNAFDVSCVDSKCRINSCRRGYTISANGTACEVLEDPMLLKSGSPYRRASYGRERQRRSAKA